MQKDQGDRKRSRSAITNIFSIRFKCFQSSLLHMHVRTCHAGQDEVFKMQRTVCGGGRGRTLDKRTAIFTSYGDPRYGRCAPTTHAGAVCSPRETRMRGTSVDRRTPPASSSTICGPGSVVPSSYQANGPANWALPLSGGPEAASMKAYLTLSGTNRPPKEGSLHRNLQAESGNEFAETGSTPKTTFHEMRRQGN
ncbi:hypothetical protein AcW1_009557 [Taiwanofungus camphoratus]|nr:hypothetical protein AcW1_009557 [Antrodia cinnamomea]